MNDDSIAKHMYCHVLSVLLTGQKKKKKKKKKNRNFHPQQCKRTASASAFSKGHCVSCWHHETSATVQAAHRLVWCSKGVTDCLPENHQIDFFPAPRNESLKLSICQRYTHVVFRGICCTRQKQAANIFVLRIAQLLTKAQQGEVHILSTKGKAEKKMLVKQKSPVRIALHMH